MDGLYENEEEALRHSTTIEGLAKSQGIRPDDVRSLYESVLAKMKRDAVIMDFLPIFAARQVKEILRRRGGSWGHPPVLLSSTTLMTKPIIIA